MKDYKYRPRNKEQCAGLLAERFLVRESLKPENENVDEEILRNRLYFSLIKKNFRELKEIYHNPNINYESAQKYVCIKKRSLEEKAKSSEIPQSPSSAVVIRKGFETLSRICGDCFEPTYNSISGIKAQIELELRRLERTNKIKYNELKAEYEGFKEQYPILKQRVSKKLILTG